MPCGTTTIPMVSPAITSRLNHPRSGIELRIASQNQTAEKCKIEWLTVTCNPLDDREEAQDIIIEL
jgi:hypothetical protein